MPSYWGYEDPKTEAKINSASCQDIVKIKKRKKEVKILSDN
jgi:hypothetical protein